MTNPNESETSVFNRPTPGLIDFLLTRRSGSAKAMEGPGPSESELRTILTAAARVPDHGKIFPWRLIVFQGNARLRAGEMFADCLRQNEPDAGEVRLEIEQRRFTRAPIVVGVVSRVTQGLAIPEWEQELSAGAVCQTMLIASVALGYIASWLTEWPAYDAGVRKRFGLADNERIAGFIYIGKPAAPLKERARPVLDDIVTMF